MTDLAFQPEFMRGIADGSKRLTLRKAWANGRTPDLGTILGMVVNPRTPRRHKFATAVVQFRATIGLHAKGIGMVQGFRVATIAPGAREIGTLLKAVSGTHHRMIGDAEYRDLLDRFAQLDGFVTWDELWDWHNRHRAKGSDPAIVREVIGFGSVTVEQPTLPVTSFKPTKWNART